MSVKTFLMHALMMILHHDQRIKPDQHFEVTAEERDHLIATGAAKDAVKEVPLSPAGDNKPAGDPAGSTAKPADDSAGDQVADASQEKQTDDAGGDDTAAADAAKKKPGLMDKVLGKGNK